MDEACPRMMLRTATPDSLPVFSMFPRGSRPSVALATDVQAASPSAGVPASSQQLTMVIPL
jgi:hypothetical protein